MQVAAYVVRHRASGVSIVFETEAERLVGVWAGYRADGFLIGPAWILRQGAWKLARSTAPPRYLDLTGRDRDPGDALAKTRPVERDVARAALTSALDQCDTTTEDSPFRRLRTLCEAAGLLLPLSPRGRPRVDADSPSASLSAQWMRAKRKRDRGDELPALSPLAARVARGDVWPSPGGMAPVSRAGQARRRAGTST